ncbi:MAG: chromosome segregation protein SMC [Acidobacteriota bacterium]
MLKLDRLAISGFKSFVEPVSIQFAGGITAIVGPNGCGKSNLADAVTWVLGEQSAKSLRGGKMEDVIFAGSQRRKPLGMGEVSLSLKADPSIAGTDDGRLEIGRRVFRTGESRYLLNGKVVRLKEIKDLLMDTGLGIRAYSVIEQGKIGMILSGKPQERRKLLEEAAGITRYKARRRVAELKLEEARGNLLRLDDILSEVERSLRSLKRQAGAARRYREREAEHRELLGKVLLGRWSHLSSRLAEVDERIAAAQSQEAEITAALSLDEASLAEGRETLDRLAEELAERHQHHADLGATIEGRQQYLTANRQRLEELGDRAAQSRTLAARRGSEIEENEGRLGELEERRKERVRELGLASEEVDRDQDQIAAADRALGEAGARVDALKAEMAAGADRQETLRRQLHQADIQLEKNNVRRHRLDHESEEQAAELAQARGASELSKGQVDNLAAELEGRRQKHGELEQALETTRGREAEAARRVTALEEEVREAQQRSRLLTELSRAHAERRSRVEEALAQAGVDAPVFLADRVEVLAGWERSLDFYLAGLTDAVVLGDSQNPLDLAKALSDADVGTSLIQPLATSDEGAPEVDDPAALLSVQKALALGDDLTASLPPAYLVEASADAARLARQHPGVAFISRDGVWAASGVLNVESRQAAPGVLERERELADLGQEIPRLEGRLADARGQLAGLVEQRSHLARDFQRLQEEMTQQRQELAVAQTRHEATEARCRRIEEAIALLAGERRGIEDDVRQAQEAQSAATRELTEVEVQQTQGQERLDRLVAERENAKADRESLKEASAGRRGRLDLLRERLEAHDREMARLRRELGEGEEQIHQWREEATRLDAARQEIRAGLEAADRELQAALEQRTGAQEAVLAAQTRLDEQRADLKELEGAIAARRNEIEKVRGLLGELRVRRAGLGQEAEHLSASYLERFEEGLPENAGEAPPNLPEMEADLGRLKATLERLGPVNLLAVDEYAEKEERHGFLTQQRADVVDSIERLKETIREIDEASTERFTTTFAAVNESFSRIFTHLFRGGEAEMRLLDEEDVLESGIEIVARPPGKRTQNIMLMSGGEKALTAIALLFALFQAKPSPFCILDEVDAPLDDVNTLRFVDLVREMAGETQFIVITHNKLTMEAASTLYGVTMEEKGVSKLVAVEMDEVQPATGNQAPEAATA